MAYHNGRYYFTNGALRSVSEEGSGFIFHGEFDGNLDKTLLFLDHDTLDIGVFCLSEGEGLMGVIFNQEEKNDEENSEEEIEKKIENYIEKKSFQGIKELINVGKTFVLRTQNFHDMKPISNSSSIICLTHSNSLEIYKIDPLENFFNLTSSHDLNLTFLENSNRDEEYKRMSFFEEKGISAVVSTFRKSWDSESLNTLQILKLREDKEMECIGFFDLSGFRIKNLGIFDFVCVGDDIFLVLSNFSKKTNFLVFKIHEGKAVEEGIELLREIKKVKGVKFLKRVQREKTGEYLFGVDARLNLIKIKISSE